MKGVTPEQAAQLPFDLYQDGYDYYLQSHAHPNSTFRYTKSSLMDLFAFDASEGMHLINQPLLMMAGSRADTFYMTEQCYSRATGTLNKELFLIPGATHIKTYYVPEYVDQAVGKLAEFFREKPVKLLSQVHESFIVCPVLPDVVRAGSGGKFRPFQPGIDLQAETHHRDCRLYRQRDLHQLQPALNAALDSGLTINEIREVLVHSYAYCGFPRSLRGLQTFISVLDKESPEA